MVSLKKIEFFELTSVNLRSYYHNNILAFGDLLHRIHPLAGQGFNMTIRDIKYLIEIIDHRIDLGLPLDYSINNEFENKRDLSPVSEGFVQEMKEPVKHNFKNPDIKKKRVWSKERTL